MPWAAEFRAAAARVVVDSAVADRAVKVPGGKVDDRAVKVPGVKVEAESGVVHQLTTSQLPDACYVQYF